MSHSPNYRPLSDGVSGVTRPVVSHFSLKGELSFQLRAKSISSAQESRLRAQDFILLKGFFIQIIIEENKKHLQDDEVSNAYKLWSSISNTSNHSIKRGSSILQSKRSKVMV